MTLSWRALVVGALVLAPLASAPSEAQAALTKSGNIYRLDGGTFSEGCLPPCLCPILFQGGLRGAFVLRPITLGGTFEEYAVEQIIWTVTNDFTGEETRVKGTEGTYTRISGIAGWVHRLQVVLSVDGGPEAKFDSGLVDGGGDFPDIQISIADNDFFCYNRVFSIEASLAPKPAVTRYALNGATLTEGCFPPCLCPVKLSGVKGTFDLVLLENLGTIAHYAVLNVNWRNAPFLTAFVSPRPKEFYTGFGNFTEIQGFAGPIHEMSVCISTNGGPLIAFDSGLVNVSPGLPCIDIGINQNGLVCFDRLFNVVAKPVPYSSPDSALMAQ